MKCTDSWTGKDKSLHFTVCLLIALLCPLLALAAAIAKEAYDWRTPGNHWCWKDIVADVAGMVIGSALHVLLLWLIIKSIYIAP